MFKKIFLTLLGLSLLIGVLAAVKISQFKILIAAGTEFVQPPTTVTTSQVTQERWQPTLNAVGSVVAVQGVTLSAEQAGTVRRIAFASGDRVREGQLLVEFDGEVEQAELRAAQASAELAHANLKRARELRPKNMLSQADLDSAEAQAKQAEAQIDHYRAALAKKTPHAPFAGQTGIQQINLGQFLNTGDPIVSLNALDPVYVDFALPQQRLAQLALGMSITVTSDAFPNQAFSGRLTVINPEVERATRMVRLRATLNNPQDRLRPGMFVNVAALLPDTQQVLMIPATAVLYAPYGDSVFIVEEQKDEKTGALEKVLKQQFVQLGRSRGDFVAIASGVAVGQVIVTTGVFKLRNGMRVIVDNTLAPDFQLAPQPHNS